MTYYELMKSSVYKLHHRAIRRGYISRRKPPKVEEYSGKYGTGYIARLPRYDSSRYHTVEYYIKEGHQDEQI